jgi:NAD(P)-dependent dehydrogenase (short-subunit alcohol dehydrogenase family)
VPTRLCTATRHDGKPCRAKARLGRDRCAFHDVAEAARCREGRRKGGRASHRPPAVVPVEAPDLALSSASDVATALALVANRTLKGALDVKVCNAAVYALATLTRVLDGAELTRRVEALEQALRKTTTTAPTNGEETTT